MITLTGDTRVWLAAGMTDMRKGFDGLSALVATTLEPDPLSGHVFVFRGKRGDRIKLLWYIVTFTVMPAMDYASSPSVSSAADSSGRKRNQGRFHREGGNASKSCATIDAVRRHPEKGTSLISVLQNARGGHNTL